MVDIETIEQRIQKYYGQKIADFIKKEIARQIKDKEFNLYKENLELKTMTTENLKEENFKLSRALDKTCEKLEYVNKNVDFMDNNPMNKYSKEEWKEWSLDEREKRRCQETYIRILEEELDCACDKLSQFTDKTKYEWKEYIQKKKVRENNETINIQQR